MYVSEYNHLDQLVSDEHITLKKLSNAETTTAFNPRCLRRTRRASGCALHHVQHRSSGMTNESWKELSASAELGY